MTLISEHTLARGLAELKVFAHVILIFLSVHNAVVVTLITCSAVIYLALIAPWSTILVGFLLIEFLIIHIVLLWEALQANPLAEEDALHRWTGLGLLCYTAPTRRLYKKVKSIGLVRTQLPALPPELWEQIVVLSLESPAILTSISGPPEDTISVIRHQMLQFYDTSSPFLRYASYNFGIGPDEEHPYRMYRRRCANLSLVCKFWTDVVQRQQRLWSCGVPGDGVYPRVQRLDLKLESRSRAWLENILRQQQEVTPRDQLGNLRVLSLFKASMTDPITTSSLLSLLSDSSPHSFPSLKSLSYVADSDSLDFTMSPSPFPNLCCLYFRLFSIKYANKIRFERLRVLTLEGVKLDLRGWECPQLEHCAIILCDTVIIGATLALPPSGHIYVPSRLLSLVVIGYQVTLSAEFWHRHSSLVHLAIQSSSLIGPIYPPPTDHPFAHFSLLDVRFTNSPAARFQFLLDPQHKIESISLPNPNPSYWRVYYNEWVQFYRKASRLGLIKSPSHPPGWWNQIMSQLWLLPSPPNTGWPSESGRLEVWMKKLVSAYESRWHHDGCDNIQPGYITLYIQTAMVTGLASSGSIVFKNARHWNALVISDALWWQGVLLFLATFTHLSGLLERSSNERLRQRRVPNLGL
ncbi:hypothetical protein PIIN_06864 [Serendipita indica DSM 11827]|uniref:Uncharacterized protein n=1 Tax=Serendipita indica (strain DSM 11827) TaxID=1109443 RepID=G4TNN5_SERID|nr:hypothetical protein PIIN_06864 [Serendipita indica DSM 11827]